VLDVWLGWGDKECIENVDGETSWKTSTWKTDKEMGC
jgi:hypothetical protein